MAPNSLEPIFGNRYKIVWCINHEPIVGIVRNYSIDNLHRRDIRIMKNDPDFEKTKFRLIAHAWGENGPAIYGKELFFQLEDYAKEALIWHEVGHIHYEHTLKPENQFGSQSKLRDYRNSFVKNNDVWPIEIEADIFAVKRVGKTPYLRVLNAMLISRPRGEVDSLNELGRKELEIRINKIKELIL